MASPRRRRKVAGGTRRLGGRRQGAGFCRRSTDWKPTAPTSWSSTPTLQTTRDPNIFALGDCAAAPWTARPARAAAGTGGAPAGVASGRQLIRRLDGKPLPPFVYRDFGSLVSLGEYSTVGSLMGKLVGGSMMIEGYFARMMYLSLYKMHERALHGTSKVALSSLSRALVRRSEPHVKLH